MVVLSQTLILAKTFGIAVAIISLGMLFNLDDTRRAFTEMSKSPVSRMLSASNRVLIGSCIVAQYFTSEVTFSSLHPWDWVVFAMGVWLLCVGCLRLWFAQFWVSLVKKHLDKMPIIDCLFGLIFSLLLIYIGYFVPLHYMP